MHIDPINDLTVNSFIVYKEQSKNIMKLTIPFYLHKVGAGFPSPATDYIEDDLDLNTHLITNAPATFIIRVQGKSMREAGIYDGDLLIVDKSINPKSFSTVIANVNEELVVKTLIKEKEINYLTSGSENIIDKINLSENPEVIIWGVVTYVIHKLQ
jgi:DNA polymerase V